MVDQDPAVIMAAHLSLSGNKYERALCKMRAKMASKALGWTDRYFVASGLMRENCEMSDGWLDRIWKFTKSSVRRYI